VQHALGETLGDMLEEVKQNLHQEPYTKDEVCQELGVTAEVLVSTSLSENTLHGEQLYMLHVKATLYSILMSACACRH
jgi:N-acetylgalactosamine kinase